VEAPEALRSVHCPAHTALGVAKAETTGTGFTVTAIWEVAEHPAVLVPVTV